MQTIAEHWDYLIITASNEKQASAYESQLYLRRKLGFIPGVKQLLVLSDPGGKRIGSGGSTIYSLLNVLNRELRKKPGDIKQLDTWEKILQKLRILIIHAGGDSRRLPAYGPCGKVFIPVPGESGSILGQTLFDRQLPIYLRLPATSYGQGQVVVTTGDVFLDFDPDDIQFFEQGITGLGCQASPELASDHGVYCSGPDGKVHLFLQKPSFHEQKSKGALNRYGQSMLDIGILNFDAASAFRLLNLGSIKTDSKEGLKLSGPLYKEIMFKGLDLYREICCAMGEKVEYSHYINSVRNSGSDLSESSLKSIYKSLSKVNFFVKNVPQCGFLHFGTMRQLIKSGADLLRKDRGTLITDKGLRINNDISIEGHIIAKNAWIEGCYIGALLTLGGENVIVGVDIEKPLNLPSKFCLNVIKGKDQEGKKIWFVQVCGIDDRFKIPISSGAVICDQLANDWLEAMDTEENDIWPPKLADKDKNLWNARIIPATKRPTDYHRWLWIFKPEKASQEQKNAWKAADRYSAAEIAQLVDQDAFYSRRILFRAWAIQHSLRWIFRLDSDFSAAEMALIFTCLPRPERARWVRDIMKEARYQWGDETATGMERLEFSRIIHTLGSAILMSRKEKRSAWDKSSPELSSLLEKAEKDWLASLRIKPDKNQRIEDWGKTLKAAAFENLSRTIVLSKKRINLYPKNAVRSDEIIWGRAPARLDLGGGWTDTPPYALEKGGCVINAAVNLNGQPPIHVYARKIKKLEIHIASIDHGVSLVISKLDELLDYKKATSKFGLAKAAIALSGFAPDKADWPEKTRSLRSMLELFGGGIEITTLAAIPSGSGLGTSSIMGAVLISVIARMIGQNLSQRELFHRVLQLEQELTTGGGWQDQIGGSVEGVKIINTDPGMIPDPRIHYLPSDVLDPEGEQILLYYTGIRRLAKNILQHVVGNYLDRDRESMATLQKIHNLPPLIVDAMTSKDTKRFGELIDFAWRLNKEIDPGSTTPVIENILKRLRPYMYGAKLLGAGGGGFLLIICKSPELAASARKLLENKPPNRLARFFDYGISKEGLLVTVC